MLKICNNMDKKHWKRIAIVCIAIFVLIGLYFGYNYLYSSAVIEGQTNIMEDQYNNQVVYLQAINESGNVQTGVLTWQQFCGGV